MNSLIFRKFTLIRQRLTQHRLLLGRIKPAAILPLVAGVLVTGCGALPKSELQAIQAHCPDVLNVWRSPDNGGETVKIRIKTSRTNSMDLDAARVLKRLVTIPEFATLPDAGRQLQTLSFRKRAIWIDEGGRERVFNCSNPRIQNWPNVLNLSDEELSALASRPQSRTNDPWTYNAVLFMPLYDAKCPTWRGGHNYFHCK